MRICIDVDGTICITKAAHESYADATPMPGAIDAIKKLKDAGHYIIIATARGMKTYESNLGRIVANQSVILIDWLNKYEIPSKNWGLVLGNESQGISEEILKSANVILSIEGAKKMESLNVAEAGSIIMYQLFKK